LEFDLHLASGTIVAACVEYELQTQRRCRRRQRLVLTEGDSGSGTPTISGFDVAADGRLLMTRVVPAAPGDDARLVLLQNWPGVIAARR
jgi:hypothetical protein